MTFPGPKLRKILDSVRSFSIPFGDFVLQVSVARKSPITYPRAGRPTARNQGALFMDSHGGFHRLRRITYNSDGLATCHAAAFLGNTNFMVAYQAAMRAEGEDRNTHWRLYNSFSLARIATRLDGDFFEFGVGSGATFNGILHYAGLAERRVYLVDTFSGVPDHQLREGEELQRNRAYHNASYEHACEVFRLHPYVRIVRGEVPAVLASVQSERIAFAHIDMNVAEAELHASKYVWERLAPGGMILYDDYGFFGHEVQKSVLDEFACSIGREVLALPTGQGLLIK
jgi:hypothetical protein